jgi:hypothetical protein
MNSTSTPDPAEIRSEIDTTRQRMDDTLDALGQRLQGRHLIDEVLGFFRNNSDRSRELGQKLSHTASSAMNSLTDTVKANPVPALLIGAGVGWMIYQSRRSSSSSDYEYDYESGGGYARGESDSDLESLYDRPLDYPASSTAGAQGGSAFEETGYNAGGFPTSDTQGSSKLGQAREKVAEKTQQVKQRLADVGSRVRDRSQAVGEQARELRSRVQERARDSYQRGRERVVSTAHERPIELGLACLALGVIAGLAVRTPARLDRAIGPTVDRLRDRTREAGSELLQKGQRVAHAAAEAAKDEAKSQGLTPENSANATGENENASSRNQPQADPLATRPVM